MTHLRLAGLQNAAAALWLLPLAVGQLLGISLRDWLGLAVLGVVFTALAHALFIQPAGVGTAGGGGPLNRYAWRLSGCCFAPGAEDARS